MSSDRKSVMNSSKCLLLLAFALGPVGMGCGRSSATAPRPAVGTTPTLQDSDDPSVVKEATFDDLKFEMDEAAEFEKTMLTPKVEKLFDRRIRIRGYIYPTLKKRGLKEFVLVRDNLECCFGPGAALFDCIVVHMEEGKTAEFTIRPVAVQGKFLFEEFLDYDGTVRAIYRLQGELVE